MEPHVTFPRTFTLERFTQMPRQPIDAAVLRFASDLLEQAGLHSSAYYRPRLATENRLNRGDRYRELLADRALACSVEHLVADLAILDSLDPDRVSLLRSLVAAVIGAAQANALPRPATRPAFASAEGGPRPT